MSVLTTSASYRQRVALHAGGDSQLAIVTLCAAWCHTCTEFRAGLESVARERPAAAFIWLDIEDDCDVCGDVDVDNVPTLVAFRNDAVLHYGITVPSPGVGRLVDALAVREHGLADVPVAVRQLGSALLGLAGGAA